MQDGIPRPLLGLSTGQPQEELMDSPQALDFDCSHVLILVDSQPQEADPAMPCLQILMGFWGSNFEMYACHIAVNFWDELPVYFSQCAYVIYIVDCQIIGTGTASSTLFHVSPVMQWELQSGPAITPFVDLHNRDESLLQQMHQVLKSTADSSGTLCPCWSSFLGGAVARIWSSKARSWSGERAMVPSNLLALSLVQGGLCTFCGQGTLLYPIADACMSLQRQNKEMCYEWHYLWSIAHHSVWYLGFADSAIWGLRRSSLPSCMIIHLVLTLISLES